MSWSNYDDVLGQLRSAGLHVERLEIGSPRAIRCLVEGGGREKRGWYMLHELHVDSGKCSVVVGDTVLQVSRRHTPHLREVLAARRARS